MMRLTGAAFVFALAIGASACSGSPTPPTVSTPAPVPVPAPAPVPVPIASANLVTPSGVQLSLPGCEATVQLAFLLGLSTATCPGFDGTLQNTGAGCAANVRGTTTIFKDAAGLQSIGSTGWAYDATVRPGEQFAFHGRAIVITSSGTWYWRTSA
jgi:hypothetical protein